QRGRRSRNARAAHRGAPARAGAMRRAAAMTLAVLSASSQAQTPRPERLEACADAVVAAAEHYRLASGEDGTGGSVDWLRCAAPDVVYTLGAASYSLGGSRWRFAKAAASVKPHERPWLSADLNPGSGHG